MFALLALPFTCLVVGWRGIRLGRNAVIRLTIGGGRRPMDPVRFHKLVGALERLAEDSRPRALFLEVRPLRIGWQQLYTLVALLSRIRASGKVVVAHTSGASDRELLLASTADHFTVSPAGDVHLTGLAAPLMFYGDALARHGVVIDLESAGAYKSFGESYTRAFPTQANREALDALLQDLQNRWRDTVADHRGLEPAEVEGLLKTMPMSAEQAEAAGLIDGAAYADELEGWLEEKLGKKPRTVPIRSYDRLTRLANRLLGIGRPAKRIAVLHLEGPVVERTEQVRRPGRLIASDDVVPVLQGLVEQDGIEAVVLRVNSPGGSALASDLIARCVDRLAEKKPVIACMGNVAASGGYYIAAGAHEIVAHPATITGSIGVVGGKVVLGQALGRLGVHSTFAGPAPDPGMMASNEPFSPEQRVRFRNTLKRVYDRFLAVVAEGRDMTPEQVEPVAQGRVWTGAQAQGHGLVDHLGGLDTAIERAQDRAGLVGKRIRPIHIRFEPSKWAMLSPLTGGAQLPSAEDLVLDNIGPDAVLLSTVRHHPGAALALAPWPVDPDAWSAWS